MPQVNKECSMEKRKRQMLYCIPFVLELILHFSATLSMRFTGISPWRIFTAVLITAFAMLLGEGYAAFVFIFAGSSETVGIYTSVIVLSILGAGANLVGFLFTGIEYTPRFWMTASFWCIDLFLFVFSIVRINKLPSKKKSVN